jgi:hypothetical protein
VRRRLAGAALGLGLAATSAAPAATQAPSAIEQAYRAGKAAPTTDASRAAYQRGIELARAALVRAPDEPDALLWLAANLAGEALTHGKLHALRVIPEIEASLLRLERVAPRFGDGAAARALANLYWKAPAIISVGSSKKAAAYFDLALARSPGFPGNQALAAAYFASGRDCARARPLALAVASRADLDAFGPDAAEWRELARDVLRDCGR